MFEWYRIRKERKERQKEIELLESRLTRYRRRLREVDRSSKLAFFFRDEIMRTMAEISRLKQKGTQ
jgi:hypothetical protein